MMCILLLATLAAIATFFQSVDGYSIVLGVFAIVTALLSLFLSLVELRDKRKRVFSLQIKTIKTIAGYASFALAIFALLVQTQNEVEAKIDSIKKERKVDSTQVANLDTTLSAINKTLSIQVTTLDSTDIVLKHQRKELVNQIEMLKSQKIAIYNYSKIIKSQVKIAEVLNSSIMLLNQSIDVQRRNQEMINETSGKLDPLNYPISNSFGLMFKIRIYVKGESELWKAKGNGTTLLLPVNKKIEEFVASDIGKMDYDVMTKYWRFFTGLTHYGLEYSYAINYRESDTSKGDALLFATFNSNNFSIHVSLADIYYNSEDHFFEISFELAPGLVVTNMASVTNFKTLINNSTLYLKLKYSGPKNNLLPVSNRVSKNIEIDHVEVSEVTKLRYGNSLQLILTPKKELTSNLLDRRKINDLWGDDIADSSAWRYSLVKFPLSKE